MKRIAASSRVTTCASSAGRSAFGATPARARIASEVVPSAATIASAACVAGGSPAILERAARRASREPGAARAGRRPPRERGPAPARRTGFRPTARGSGAASDARTACRAGRAGGDEVRRRSGGRPAAAAPAQRRSRARARGLHRRVGEPPCQQHANAIRRESPQRERERRGRGRSSHWTSSIASRIVLPSPRSCNTSRTATPSARSSRDRRRPSRRSATSSARRLGACSGAERRRGHPRSRSPSTT